MNVITVQLEIELTVATASDLKELDYFKVLANGEKEKEEKLRTNLPFWLVGSSGELEPYIHFLNDDWHPAILKEYLDNEQIYIHKKG
jgi:hypothetical protein